MHAVQLPSNAINGHNARLLRGLFFDATDVSDARKVRNRRSDSSLRKRRNGGQKAKIPLKRGVYSCVAFFAHVRCVYCARCVASVASVELDGHHAAQVTFGVTPLFESMETFGRRASSLSPLLKLIRTQSELLQRIKYTIFVGCAIIPSGAFSDCR